MSDFESVGSILTRTQPQLRNKYENLTDDELKSRWKIAYEWCKNNEGHPKYPEAEDRYKDLEDCMRVRGIWIS